MGLLAGRVQWMEKVLRQPTCRKLSCWPAREAKTVGGGTRGFCPTIEVLEGEVSYWVAAHSSLDLLCIIASCQLHPRDVGIFQHTKIYQCNSSYK